MSPRRSAAASAGTRDQIVLQALRLASSEGFEAASLGRLATDLSMSKAGVIGHFGTMDALHLAAVAAAIETFQEQVWKPAEKAAPGVPRLKRISRAWIRYLQSRHYVGGCFNSGEYHRSSVVREAVRGALQSWQKVLVAEVRAAQAAGDISSTLDPADVAFALSAAASATGQSLRLGLDPRAAARGGRLMRRVLAADGGA